MTTMQKVSWTDIETYVNNLALVLNRYQWDGIIGVSRGGLIPAVMLSNKLDIKFLGSIEAVTYDEPGKINEKGTRLGPLVNIPKELKEDRIIIVDDILETGSTAKALYEHYPDAYYLFMGKRQDTNLGRLQKYYYSATWEHNKWLTFPWEPEPEKVPFPF